ncbi:uncharacterized protein LOC117227105 [Megalopta genalis]|uniref:uncharacterized protein LOC117227105 n=1 Tax=Megalopta genalis TaxID=115081 RepID=UPI003FD4921A
MMDNCYAPQWADFAGSPQLSSDSYFEVEHEVHSARIDLKSNLKCDLSLPCKEENIEESLDAETNFDDSLEPTQGPRSNIAFFIMHNNKKQKETNNDNIKKDIKPLKFDERYAWDVSMTGLTSKTKTAVVPQRLKAAALSKEIRKNTCVMEMKNNILCKPAQKAQRRQSDQFKTKQPQRKVLTCQYRRRSLMKYHRRSRQFVSMAQAISKFQNETPERFHTTSNKDLKLGPSVKSKQPPLKLTHPVSPTLRCKQRVRRTNILSQEEREALEMEEMKKFQIKANPVPVNILKKPSALKKVAKKLNTVTEEFNLTSNSKNTHHAMVPQLPQQCNNEKIHKNTVSINRFSSVSILRKNDKQQTQTNVKPIIDSTSTLIVKKDNKEQTRKNPKTTGGSISASNVRKNEEQTSENTKSMSYSLSASNITKQADKEETQKNSGPISRSLSASNVRKIIKEQTNKYFIPNCHSTNASSIALNNTMKPVMTVLPFSFEARNKEFQLKKEEKLKNLQMQETIKLKSEFHAKPLPKFSKSTNIVKEIVTKKRTVVPCPFSFAERDKYLAKKKEELVNKIQENDKKVPVFHANPAPTFKPVVINSVFKEKSLNKNSMTKQVKNPIDQENKQPNIVTNINDQKNKMVKQCANNETHKKPFKSTNDNNEIVKANQKKSLFKLNTDKRTKGRNDFDEKLKKREQEMEAKRQHEEKQKLLKEKSERAELRKFAEVKATPIPVYKPMVILKSPKPPTSPKDPKWTSKNRLKSTCQV